MQRIATPLPAHAPATRQRAAGGHVPVRHVYAALLLIYAVRTLLFALQAPFPIPFDEHAHVSYVLHIAARGDWWPPLADLRLIDPAAPEVWTGEANYLNHPSPYYVLLSWLAALVPPAATIVTLRLANVVLAVAAVALLLKLGARLAVPAAAKIAYGTLVVLVPTLPVLGGIVNNDNLALLGGALCCIGAHAVVARRGGTRPWAALAGGLLLAGLAKLTGLLLCGLLVAAVLTWRAWRDGPARLGRGHLALVVAAGALACLPYLTFWFDYGSAAPFTSGQAAKIEARLDELPAWRESRLTFARYLGHFGVSLLVYWPPAPPAVSFDLALLGVPAICLALGTAGIVASLAASWRNRAGPDAAFIACGGLALATVMLVHLGFTYERHLETGWLRGIYPRYYFPLLAVLPAAVAWLLARVSADRPRLWIVRVLVSAVIAYDLLHRFSLFA